jgi:hypothetical protein
MAIGAIKLLVRCNWIGLRAGMAALIVNISKET